MLENINIDSVMKEYYHCICSDKLSSDNINIDDTLEIENSFTKYLQLFASFLNESYYRGYVLSGSILKKLMDIIEYEGYEYQILDEYIKILFDGMKDYHCDDDNRPTYREIVLEAEDSKNFVMEYLDIINNMNTYTIQSIDVPHFRNPESTKQDKNFTLYSLIEEEYPINLIYKDLSNNFTTDRSYPEKMKVVYDENINAYKSLISKDKSPYCLFFLLDEDSNRALDILVNKISTLPQLANLIRACEDYMAKTITADRVRYRFNDTINNNIRRLIELLTINVSIEQTAMIIGTDYDLWRTYCDENYHELNTLLYAVNLYQSDPDRFIILNPVDYIFKIREVYPKDVYFYARNVLLSMDYRLFCNNFIEIFNELLDQLEENVLKDLFNECFDGLINLGNTDVIRALINLDRKLVSLNYILTNRNGTAIEYSNNTLTSTIIDKNLSNAVYKYMELFNLKEKLFKINGDFNEDILPFLNTDFGVRPNYRYITPDKSVINNIIHKNDYYKISIGSIIRDVRAVQPMDQSFNLELEYYDNSFRLCNSDNALFVAFYLNKEDEKFDHINLLVIAGENNNKLKLESSINSSGKILLGIMNTTDNSFIYADGLIEDESNSMVGKLYEYANQNKDIINSAEEGLIMISVRDNITYITDTYDENANTKLILSSDFDYDDNRETIVLL